MSCEQPSFETVKLRWEGFTATASSKLVILTLRIVTFDPAGSMPSVFKGFVGQDNSVLSPIS